ncbi:MAG: RHS repeat protein [Clostridia bacterium]|nr:RHS repeat protein [Clostridia bacterium]
MFGTTATLVASEDVEYDANGNITKYGDVTYEYDKLGRLVRENNPHEDIDKTTTWCYDICGNLTSYRGANLT